MIRNPAIIHFLQGLIDYAGLFPPAGLGLAEALASYRTYQAHPCAFMLGRFVCPAARLTELRQLLQPDDRILISALLSTDLELVQDFNQEAPRNVRVDCLEVPFPGPEPAAQLQRRWGYYLFFETTAEAAPQAASGLAAGPRVGLKLRTGSTYPEGFPEASSIARFVQVAQRAQVPYKFTAGLHHARPGLYPLTYAPDSPAARMQGFLHLFAACAWMHQGALGEEEFCRLLSASEPPVVQAHGLSWGELQLTSAQLAQFRSAGARSFGSCSFEEPLQELTEMGWI